VKLNVDIIAENLLAIHPLLYKSISKPIKNKSSITPGSMFVMGILKRNGMLSMSEIGNCLSMPKPHVTVIVDRLIEEAYVLRQNDPSDRRVVNILLTEKGLVEFEELKEALSINLKSKLNLLSEEEQEELSKASQKMKEILISILSKEKNKEF
jgi:DNA-binding MarR family transcriptional regulator